MTPAEALETFKTSGAIDYAIELGTIAGQLRLQGWSCAQIIEFFDELKRLIEQMPGHSGLRDLALEHIETIQANLLSRVRISGD